MPIRIEHLSKIRGASLQELRIRSRQGVAKLSDRILRARAKEMSDEELFHEIHSARRDGIGVSVADPLFCRIRSDGRRFLPSLGRRQSIVETMNRRFPAERDAIIETAEG